MKPFRSPVYDPIFGDAIGFIHLPSEDSLDPDAKAYIDDVKAEGVTVSLAQQNTINQFFIDSKSAPTWSSHKKIYFPIWGNAIANSICMKTLVKGTFAGTVTHGAGFIQGDAITGRMLTGESPTSLGFTTASAWCGYLRKAIGVPVNKGAFGCHENGYVDPFRLVEAGGANYFNFTNFAQATVVNAALNDFIGIVSGKSFGATMRMVGRDASGIVHSATATPLGVYGNINDVEIYLLCENHDLNPTVNHSNDQFGAFWFGDGVSDADDEAFTLKLKALWEGCTGLALP